MTLEIGNRGPSRLFPFSAGSLEIILQQPCGNQENRHFHMSTIFTPYGGPACPGHGRPAQAVKGKGEGGDVVLVLQFGVRSLHGGFE